LSGKRNEIRASAVDGALALLEAALTDLDSLLEER
jgi:hypothetical protein